MSKPHALPTYERLHELFVYDADTGIVTRKILARAGTNAKVGAIVGMSTNRSGYRCVSINRRSYQLSRIIWKMVYNEDPPCWIDHINRIRHDNRIVNLRLVSIAENCRNRKAHSNSKTGFLGITFVKSEGLYTARVMVKGRSKFLGYFLTANQAAMERAYYECSLR